jgi:hypothetical protein
MTRLMTTTGCLLVGLGVILQLDKAVQWTGAGVLVIALALEITSRRARRRRGDEAAGTGRVRKVSP